MGKKNSKSKSQDTPPKAGLPKSLENTIHNMNFRRNIFQVCKQKKICKSFKKTTMDLLNEFTNSLFKTILKEAGILCQKSERKMLDSNKLDVAV